MKRTITLFICLGFILVVSMGSKNGRANASGEGNTGAPGDKPYICNECHKGGTYDITAAIRVLDENNNPVTKYVPAKVYKVSFSFTTVSGTSPNGYGFQLVGLLDSNNSGLTGFAGPSTDAQISVKNNRQYFEHNKPSIQTSFMVNWTAPDTGSGSVSFYAVGNGTNTNNSETGDKVIQAPTLHLEEASASINQPISRNAFSVFPNPVLNEFFIHGISDVRKIRLYDAAGRLLKQWDTYTANDALSGQELNPGVYYIQSMDNSGKLSGRSAFIKM